MCPLLHFEYYVLILTPTVKLYRRTVICYVARNLGKPSNDNFYVEISHIILITLIIHLVSPNSSSSGGLSWMVSIEWR